MTRATAIILSAGSGERCGLTYNKVFYSPYLYGASAEALCDTTALRTSVLGVAMTAFLNADAVDKVVMVAAGSDLSVAETYANYYSSAFQKDVIVVEGGATRTESVRRGLTAVDSDCETVCVHDGARPYIDSDTISDLISQTIRYGSAVPIQLCPDSVYNISESQMEDRSVLRMVSTPQCFASRLLTEAYSRSQGDYPDDSSLVADVTGTKLHYAPIDIRNTKVTYPCDITDFAYYVTARQGIFDRPTRCNMRAVSHCGIGYDVHRLTEGRPLMLAGVRIPYELGLLGHSDADVVLHAIADAMLSAVGERDIGYHFPDNDDAYLGMAGAVLISAVLDILDSHQYHVVNVAATIVTQAPKLSPYIETMRASVAHLLNIPIDNVGLAATTSEGLGITDGNRAIACMATATVEQKEPQRG